MYSYEDRIRAVKLYIKLGKRLRATICQLGFQLPGIAWCTRLLRWMPFKAASAIVAHGS
jgi:hypothetical protein